MNLYDCVCVRWWPLPSVLSRDVRLVLRRKEASPSPVFLLRTTTATHRGGLAAAMGIHTWQVDHHDQDHDYISIRRPLWTLLGLSFWPIDHEVVYAFVFVYLRWPSDRSLLNFSHVQNILTVYIQNQGYHYAGSPHWVREDLAMKCWENRLKDLFKVD